MHDWLLVSFQCGVGRITARSIRPKSAIAASSVFDNRGSRIEPDDVLSVGLRTTRRLCVAVLTARTTLNCQTSYQRKPALRSMAGNQAVTLRENYVVRRYGLHFVSVSRA
jgi:hypothetical protein